MADQIHPFQDHERTEMSVRSVLIFAISLIIGTVIVLVVVAWIFGFLSRNKEDGDPISPLAPARTAPPPPRLQIYPPADLRSMRQKEAQVLNHYSYADKEKKNVRIPIERAMELLLQRGVPGGVNEPSVP
jgi:hypothetical protein